MPKLPAHQSLLVPRAHEHQRAETPPWRTLVRKAMQPERQREKRESKQKNGRDEAHQKWRFRNSR
jgi:hypothetical protein